MQRSKIFVSYSHKDRSYLERLRVHLKSLELTHKGAIDVWDDTQIGTGALWRDQIQKALQSARTAILLVSPDFLASDFIIKEELPSLLEAAEKDGLKIMPVVIKPCRFEKVDFLARFQSVNPPDQPLSKLSDWQQDEYWGKLAEDVGKSLEEEPSTPSELHSDRPPASGDASMTAVEKLNALLERSRRKRFVFLLMGRTGVGKSSTINSLAGEVVAPTNRFEPQTMQVKSYRSKVSGLTVVDTPGLCDDLPMKGKDRVYLDLITEKVQKFDCLWFVVPLSDNRMGNDERRAIRLITRAFGKRVWERALVIFTFADRVPKDDYLDFIHNRTRLVLQEISAAAGARATLSIPCVAVSNMGAETPDGKPWLGELIARVAERISENGALPFLVTIAARGGVELDSEQRRTVREVARSAISRESSTSSSVLKGALAGGIIGGVVSGAAGGSFAGPPGVIAGALVGALWSLIKEG